MSLDILGPMNDAGATIFVALILFVALLIGGALAWRRIHRLKGRLRPYLHTFETASVGMTHVSLDGRWIRVNEKMVEITGYPIDELLQLTHADISIEEDVAENRRMNAKLVAGEIDSYTLEKRYRRKDGRVVWVKTTPALARRSDGTPHYFNTVIEDIDELKRSQLALQESEARFRAFWDNSPFNQSIKDKLRNLQEINHSYRRTFGVPADQALSEIHDTDWAPQLDEFDREVLRTQTTRTADITVRRQDGEDIILRVTKFPVFDSDNEVAGLGGVSYDITS